MTSTTDVVVVDPVLRALVTEHVASATGYRSPERVKAADKAAKDLINRTKDRSRSRDERRLLTHYQRVKDEHLAALVAKHNTSIFAP
ncbi:hypothetical protein AB0F44_01085 [Nocardioides sp. NPDC023903]|uniref:hypothetical protein n=1 Tax=Nocardioides sp. NPDC023903 TaxID=3157195 RepID=UPI0033D2F205